MSWNKVEKDIEGGPFGFFKWIAIGAISLTCIGGAIKYCTKPVDMAVERMVMKQSFQYKEGMEQRTAILEANIAEIDIMLQQNPENRQDLVNQKRILSVQLKAVTINK